MQIFQRYWNKTQGIRLRPLKSAFVCLMLLFIGHVNVACQLGDSGVSESEIGLRYHLSNKDWLEVGTVSVPLSRPEKIEVKNGSGILVCLPLKRGKSSELITREAYTDFDLELDFLTSSGTRASILLPSRHRLLLTDHPTEENPDTERTGSISGNYVPRQHVGRSPGLWQHLRLSVRNGELRFVELNNVLLHEKRALKPTDPPSPVSFVVSQGGIALRNVKISKDGYVQPPAPIARRNVDPIYVSSSQPILFRSFMDVADAGKIVRAISVGHPEHVHYTYDPDFGSLVQVWRGDFLDATPMWYGRGNGTAVVKGSLLTIDKPTLALARIGDIRQAWPQDTSGYRVSSKGYVLDHNGYPSFRYQLLGTLVEDHFQPLPAGQGITRTVAVTGQQNSLYLRLAIHDQIRDGGNGSFVIGDNAWYIRTDEIDGTKPFIRKSDGRQELLVAIRSRVRYTIIF